ncbi:MAG: hypothetical protein Q7S34_01440, partial [bacterium]|nr:hypothetical protein [bacterium]
MSIKVASITVIVGVLFIIGGFVWFIQTPSPPSKAETTSLNADDPVAVTPTPEKSTPNIVSTPAKSSVSVVNNKNSPTPLPKEPVISIAPATSAAVYVFASSPRNSGTLPVRVIVANLAETGNKYGSYGLPFTVEKLTEINTAMGRLNTFVRTSSYGRASIDWKTTGVYELGVGVCDHVSYGEKVNDLIARALVVADAETPLVDYSMYIIMHPEPDCADGMRWSYEGAGNFKTFTLRGKTVHLRGIHISNLDDDFLFHEFGHTLGYLNSVGHPGYLNCPISISGGVTHLQFIGCKVEYDWVRGLIPPFDIMSGKPRNTSDYGALTKERIGWLTSADFATTAGTYTLASLENGDSLSKAIKLAIPGGDYFAYISFREPIGYVYPDVPEYKANGVTIEIFKKSYDQSSVLIVSQEKLELPLAIGITYELSTKGPTVTVDSIFQNQATIRVA